MSQLYQASVHLCAGRFDGLKQRSMHDDKWPRLGIELIPHGE
ncbi:Uncharacterised protein [Mycobacterium tuberculosis]|uniref:Uncharacterized protein n=1 Tax=Mycobacterium tuberculosis TaxID=1773 RepID=A0A0T7PR45_MYCTX|nr:Uncharacterised protein [Mycobacterium tuberculosis]CKR48915.1 Uncharacterised protein [Mycobacterium tuberculosis]COV69020.1 Uncharacterised protein [Mycobacterium tuberculosis]COX44996.1 Uncharacterised protein [Mycobacterium tuberculosis]COY54307.1 Uncharacterised protein [Mycobacterium tuberculosis]